MRILGLITLKRQTPPEDFNSWARDHWLPGLGALVSVSDAELLITHAMGGGTAPASHVALLEITEREEFDHDIASAPAAELTTALRGYADVVWVATERLPVA
ncbi:hypothetical protein IP88_14765 [alpha proteobacterium AAP81b]|nr:hypothetical protein IP88_14765 [alpha proteobacterium AAP81b]